MSGVHLAWEARKRYPELPIVILSAYLKQWTKDDLQDNGINFTLAKPFSPTELRKIVTMIMGRPEKQSTFYDELFRLLNVSGDTPARFVGPGRMVLYENDAMQKITGGMVGKNCFYFWSPGKVCSDCIADQAREKQRSCRKKFHDHKGWLIEVKAIPIPEQPDLMAEVLYFDVEEKL